MCGIVGAVSLPGGAPLEPAALKAMCATIVHRGPDDLGLYHDPNGAVAMGMRRLAIIDIAGGRQPIFNEDGSVATVFNGEIYNYRTLRRELEARGHRFQTNSDTEVIVHLWEEYGAEFAARLNGMFAIALCDRRRGRFLLARDHLGIKPLYWCHTGPHLVFGSEIKALLASGLVDRRLDVDALGQFLAWEYVPAPHTLFSGVHKLEPASLLELDLAGGGMEIRHFWDVPHAALQKLPVDEWREAVDAKITAAVKAQLMSDVPLGALLSGGVDSSLVVAATGNTRAFSIGFEDPSYDELPFAKDVAKCLGLAHSFEVIRPRVCDLFEHLMHFLDDPIADFSIFPTYLVSRLARREVTVVLTGDGGDELFGGYETYLAQAAARSWDRMPAFLREEVIGPIVGAISPSPRKRAFANMVKYFVTGAMHDPAMQHARWRLLLGDAARAALFTPEARAALETPVQSHIVKLFHDAGPRDAQDRCLYVDMKSYLADNCLVKVDRMSMACSLEARVPLLDREVVELAFSLPSELKIKGLKTKVLLKDIAARHVPHHCVYRTKRGFAAPLRDWLKGEFRPIMEELLAPARIRADGLLDPARIERLKTDHLAGRANNGHVLWALVVFQDWRRRWAV
jgi:asparagine synthase (glutamine-hydrolysing)